jgi:hopanoid biosynthesis associated radical SAM protein HpnH
MRFPFSLTSRVTAYLLKKRLVGETRFPLVLMLEPLHACNLHCTGCGRIREYASTASDSLSLGDCLSAVDECDAPVVSLCGGEPLIYPEIEALIQAIVARRKHVYLCTNGVLLEKKLPGLHPTSRLFINVHVDGMEATHDRIVEHPGVFAKAVDGIQAAVRAGFQVCTNTTIYRQTDIQEVAVLYEYLTQLGVSAMMISPAYGYESVCETAPGSEQLFLTRDETHAKFRQASDLLRPFNLAASPIYLEFLRGERELKCAAWANPTRNVCGWKGPCYLITDAHYSTYRELMEKTSWDRLGPGNDPRCEHCKMHCGFEPAAVLAANHGVRDAMKMAIWQLG